jgi:uncharacterized damage-inducible protein DinB
MTLPAEVPPPTPPEPWLRGPVPGMPPLLMPAAHALQQVMEDVERAAAGLTTDELWARPGGAASVGFHLRHLAGSTGRLLTYARGEALTAAQLAALRAEGEAGEPPAAAASLVEDALAVLRDALDVLRATPEATLAEPRTVGRAALPSTVLGLLFHTAEHAQRHAGQIVTTARIVRGLARGAA